MSTTTELERESRCFCCNSKLESNFTKQSLHGAKHLPYIGLPLHGCHGYVLRSMSSSSLPTKFDVGYTKATMMLSRLRVGQLDAHCTDALDKMAVMKCSEETAPILFIVYQSFR